MENGRLKTVIITALTLTIAFTGWTANQVVNVRENYIQQAQYYKDMDTILKAIQAQNSNINKLREIMYGFHTTGAKN